MKSTLKTLTLAMAATLAAGSAEVSAHPGWQSPAVIGATVSSYTSSFNAITVGHGCSNGQGGYLGVVAASWISPSGSTPSVTTPYSTGCDAAGKNCSGVGAQPSVQKFMNSAGTTNPTTLVTTFPSSYVGTMTSLDAELVGISTLAGRMKLNQNKGVFSTQKLHVDSNGNLAGFWEKNGFVDPRSIAVTDMRMTSGGIQFKPGTCATQLILRLAGADICKIDKKLTNEHHQNLWFGGPTAKMSTGHGVHENFWLAYTFTRPAAETANCAAGDKYTVTVMPTSQEIDTLSFPGWATR